MPSFTAHDPAATPLDVLVVGGGVTGLWAAAALRAAGHAVAVVEREALGATQSIGSQGIIHGGVKYALTGAASRASRAIAAMPARWAAAMGGADPAVDLRAARLLSPTQCLFTTGSVGAKLVALAASKAIRTAVRRAGPAERPAALQGAPAGVDVYLVDEPVLDASTLLGALRSSLRAAGVPVVHGDAEPAAGGGGAVTMRLRGLSVAARRVLLAAGPGNAPLLEALRGAGVAVPAARMQERPLHMALARAGPGGTPLPALFAHCLGASLSDKPRLTITTGRDAAGRVVWYLGGLLAEEGVRRDEPAQRQAARAELARCLPWLPWGGVQLACQRWTRAEGLTPDGARPDEPVLASGPAVAALWPTKLAFAPLAADLVVQWAGPPRSRVAGAASDAGAGEVLAALERLPAPAVGALPWDAPALGREGAWN